MSMQSAGAVVQLVRIPACHAGGRGFESRPLRQHKVSRNPASRWIFFRPLFQSRFIPRHTGYLRKALFVKLAIASLARSDLVLRHLIPCPRPAQCSIPPKLSSLYQLRQATHGRFSFRRNAHAQEHGRLLPSTSSRLARRSVSVQLARIREFHSRSRRRADRRDARHRRKRFAAYPRRADRRRMARARRRHLPARTPRIDGRAPAGLRECQLRVFVDNPAARLYIRMGYRPAGSRLAQLGAIRHMARRV